MTSEILRRYNVAKSIVEGFLSNDLVLNDGVFPHWIDGSQCFWYQRSVTSGIEYRIVDVEMASNRAAFDYVALVKAFNDLLGGQLDTDSFAITVTDITLNPSLVKFKALKRDWIFQIDNALCSEVKKPNAEGSLISPDGKNTLFVRDNNLWIREIDGGRERWLTMDGNAECPYAVAPGKTSNGIQAVWSPDSQRIFTHQLYLCGVATRRVLFQVPPDGEIRPELFESRAAYPGDKVVESYRFVAIQVENGDIQVADYRRVPLCRAAVGYFSGVLNDRLGWWGADSRIAYFIDVERGAKSVQVIEFDTNSGATRSLLKETSNTFIRLSHSIEECPLFLPLVDTAELIWFSERDGWGHLYLFDLKTGLLKNRVTEGEWIVRDILHFDVRRRELLIQTSGRDTGINPYYQDVCRVAIDSGDITPLVTGPYEHKVFVPHRIQTLHRWLYDLDVPGIDGVAPSGDYVVVTKSRVDTLPVSLVVDRAGNEVMVVESAVDIGLPAGWQWPEPFTLKGADGRTEICGVIYRPPDFCPKKTYPVLDYTSAFPFLSLLPQGSFLNDTHSGDPYLTGAAYAALGFVVVSMDLPGMPYRDKAFQDRSYGQIRSANSFGDRIYVLKKLAERYSYMDIDRVGIIGSDYTTGAVYGLLEYPDFYKVGVNVAFDDPRFGKASVVEMFEGASPPRRPYSDKLVSSLRGKLLLIHGMRDVLAPPETTLQLVDALQKAHQDFDMILEPQGTHCVTSHALLQSWNYLVRHLQKVEPPTSFEITTGHERWLLQNIEKAPKSTDLEDVDKEC